MGVPRHVACLLWRSNRDASPKRGLLEAHENQVCNPLGAASLESYCYLMSTVSEIRTALPRLTTEELRAVRGVKLEWHLVKTQQKGGAFRLSLGP
jgi:hypothetical protein